MAWNAQRKDYKMEFGFVRRMMINGCFSTTTNTYQFGWCDQPAVSDGVTDCVSCLDLPSVSFTLLRHLGFAFGALLPTRDTHSAKVGMLSSVLCRSVSLVGAALLRVATGFFVGFCCIGALIGRNLSFRAVFARSYGLAVAAIEFLYKLFGFAFRAGLCYSGSRHAQLLTSWSCSELRAGYNPARSSHYILPDFLRNNFFRTPARDFCAWGASIKDKRV